MSLKKQVVFHPVHEQPDRQADLLMVLEADHEEVEIYSGYQDDGGIWCYDDGDPVMCSVLAWAYAPIITMEEIQCLI